jgi:hypothetical protein
LGEGLGERAIYNSLRIAILNVSIVGKVKNSITLIRRLSQAFGKIIASSEKDFLKNRLTILADFYCF